MAGWGLRPCFVTDDLYDFAEQAKGLIWGSAGPFSIDLEKFINT